MCIFALKYQKQYIINVHEIKTISYLWLGNAGFSGGLCR